jgi:hypothetical protein
MAWPIPSVEHNDTTLFWLAAAFVFSAGIRYLPRYRGIVVRRDRPMPWQYHTMATIYIAALAIVLESWLMLAVAAVSLLVAMWKFWKQRVQFAIRDLLVLTFVVALFCSAGYYLPITPLLVFVGFVGMTCVCYEQCRKESLAGQAAGGGGKDCSE